MGKKNFLLLSLDDDKAKSVANTVSNATCKKILDFLSDKNGTETQISEKLKMPISTVHYNLKQLVESRLVEVESASYSEKGKEIKEYTLANKYIIIAPKGANKESFLEAVKNIIPTALLGIIGTFFVAKSTSMSSFDSSFQAAPMMAKSSGVLESAEISDNLVMADVSSEEMAFESARVLGDDMVYSQIAPNSLNVGFTIFDVLNSFQPWEWFLFGFTFAVFSIWLSLKIKKKFFKN